MAVLLTRLWRWRRFRSFLLLLTLLLPVSVSAETAALTPAPVPGPYLAELISKADGLELAGQRQWHTLLHYQPDPLFGVTSEVDGPNFFTAPNGKKNPVAELNATLVRFFDPPVADPKTDPHAQCRYPARYAWLKEQLGFDPQRLPEQACPQVEGWLATVHAEQVVMVFPSAYLNNPASMYGHTFLRFDDPEKPSLLDQAVNYAAIVAGDQKGFLYAVRGIFGAYEGHFSVWPYYTKVQEYGEYENRDIWEYTLNLTPEQLRRMLTHIWELRDTYFDYFFFKENCSYHLLALLEAADPSLELTRRFHMYTIPTDTLRLLVNTPGLVSDVDFRPARSTVIRHRRTTMTDHEVDLAMQVADGHHPAEVAPDDLSPERWTAVLELADDYLLYRESEAEFGQLAPEQAAVKNRILTARSRIGGQGPDVQVPRPAVAPHEGHRSGRLQAGGGVRFAEPYRTLQFRAAYHDLMDPDQGYEPNTRLIFFDIEGRYFPNKERAELSRLTVLDIFSLYPWDPLFRSMSWRVNAGWRSMEDRGCPHCSMAHFNFGVGHTVEANWIGRDLFYLFGDLDANYSDSFRHDHAVGGGLEAGVLLALTPVWKVGLSARYTGYALGEPFESRRTQAKTNLRLTRNVGLRAEVIRNDFRGRVGYVGRGVLNLFF